MAMTLSNVDQTLPTASDQVIAGPAAGALTILKATVCNTDAAPHKVTVNRVAMGATAEAANALVDALTVAAGETLTLAISGHSLVSGQSLYASAEVGGVVNMSVSFALTT